MSRPPPPEFPHVRAGSLVLGGYRGAVRFRLEDGTWVDATYAEETFYRKGAIVVPPLSLMGRHGTPVLLPGTLVLPLEEAAVRDHVCRVLLRGVKCFCQDPAHPPNPDPEYKCPACLGSSWRYVPRDVTLLMDTPSLGRPSLTEHQSALLLQDAYCRWQQRHPSLLGLVWPDLTPFEGVIPRQSPARMAATFIKAGKSEEAWIEGIHAYDYGVLTEDAVLLPTWTRHV